MTSLTVFVLRVPPIVLEVLRMLAEALTVFVLVGPYRSTRKPSSPGE